MPRARASDAAIQNADIPAIILQSVDEQEVKVYDPGCDGCRYDGEFCLFSSDIKRCQRCSLLGRVCYRFGVPVSRVYNQRDEYRRLLDDNGFKVAQHYKKNKSRTKRTSTPSSSQMSRSFRRLRSGVQRQQGHASGSSTRAGGIENASSHAQQQAGESTLTSKYFGAYTYADLALSMIDSGNVEDGKVQQAQHNDDIRHALIDAKKIILKAMGWESK